jgi:hypothetical protein
MEAYAVRRAGWQRDRFEVIGPISRQTALRVYHPRGWTAGNTFTPLQDIVFRGDERGCRELAQQLASSLALQNQERDAASKRHQARVSKLIAEALKATGQSSESEGVK